MWYEPTTPREVHGGIRAVSQRGSFATTWWGKEWIRILESSDIGARLSRGKSYARKGQVTELAASPGKITAKVQGSRASKYSILLECDVLAEEQKEKLLQALEEQPFLVARLLEKDLPQEMEEMFRQVGLPLFPSPQRDLETNCSCPDWSNPCKHIAAVFYLLESLSEKSSLPPEPLPLESEAFWGSHALPPLEEALPPSKFHGTLPRRLGPLPFWRSSQPLIPFMEELYRTVAEGGEERPQE
jgi:uncharacterized Zn finger protein